jgi:two-component system, cell cycle sensor histidine kinase and response regulator CckA
VENVLVLDDYPAILHGIAEVLRSDDGYAVLEASTGLQAIETGRQCGTLSLLVSDIELPDLSGTEIALALSRLYPRLPILFMSSNEIADWNVRDRANFRCLAADLIGVIQKPFSISDLVMRVRDLIGGGAQVRIDK